MHNPTDERVSSSETDRDIEAKILDLLAQRGPGKTICPSEVARAIYRPTPSDTPSADETTTGWRALMDSVRTAANRLVGSGEVVATQGGEVVDLSTAKGPIRLRRTDDGRRTE